MNAHITLVGLNHRTAEVGVRERFALANPEECQAWEKLVQGPVAEAFVLSTCNRVEILASGASADIEAHILDSWAGLCGSSVQELRPHIYAHHTTKAVEHVFCVASSLDSMVLGEPQILGQMKEAYRAATQAGGTKTILNRLLHKAFSVAKRVRTETGIASSAVSISYAAVAMAKHIFADMKDCQAMLIGAGEMAELAATHLVQAGIRKLLIVNRTYEKARELAAAFDAEAVPFDQLFTRMSEADIVISSTGATQTIIEPEDVAQVLKRRRQKPIFFIDIAVPRDISPLVNDLDNVYVYDIDNLKEVIEENKAQRQEEAVKASHIVSQESNRFIQWLDTLQLQPTIVDIIEHHQKLMDEELARTLRRLPQAGEETREALFAMHKALVSKLSHAPITFLKQAHLHSRSDTAHIDLVRRIYGLDDEPL